MGRLQVTKKGGENRSSRLPGWGDTRQRSLAAQQPALPGGTRPQSLKSCGERLTTKGIAFVDFVAPENGRVNVKNRVKTGAKGRAISIFNQLRESPVAATRIPRSP